MVRPSDSSNVSHALRISPFGPSSIPISLKNSYKLLTGKNLLLVQYNMMSKGIVGGKGISSMIKKKKPWQALPMVRSWATPAYCKLLVLIILVLSTLTHTTFVEGTLESLSIRNLTIWTIRAEQFSNTLRVVKPHTIIMPALAYLKTKSRNGKNQPFR